jgi:hypothetical protein
MPADNPRHPAWPQLSSKRQGMLARSKEGQLPLLRDCCLSMAACPLGIWLASGSGPLKMWVWVQLREAGCSTGTGWEAVSGVRSWLFVFRVLWRHWAANTLGVLLASMLGGLLYGRLLALLLPGRSFASRLPPAPRLARATQQAPGNAGILRMDQYSSHARPLPVNGGLSS